MSGATPVEVRFGSAGSGMIHDVVIDHAACDVESIWREWRPRGRILAVGQPVKYDESPRVVLARWFSDSGEIELCGSGAVALGGLLLRGKFRTSDTIELRGGYHTLLVRRDGPGVRVRLPNFELKDLPPDPELVRSLGIDDAPTVAVNQLLRTYVVCLDSCSDLTQIEPDFGMMTRMTRPDLEAVIVTSLQSDGVTFTFRYFAPWHGLGESQVAGSANALLGVFWRKRNGRDRFVGIQCTTSAPVFEMEVESHGTWIKGDFRVLSDIGR